MDNKILNFAVFILVVGLLGFTVYKNYQTADVDNGQLYNGSTNGSDNGSDNGTIVQPRETLRANYQFKDGEHIFVGRLNLPTPCHTFETEVLQHEDVYEIRIAIEDSGGICIQVIEEVDFRVQFEGQEDDFVIASISGELVHLKIFEVPVEQNIDELEVVID